MTIDSMWFKGSIFCFVEKIIFETYSIGKQFLKWNKHKWYVLFSCLIITFIIASFWHIFRNLNFTTCGNTMVKRKYMYIVIIYTLYMLSAPQVSPGRALPFSKIALIWISPDLTDDMSTLVLVKAWCCLAPSHYLCQCWPDPCRHMASLGHNELITQGVVVKVMPYRGIDMNKDNEMIYDAFVASL